MERRKARLGGSVEAAERTPRWSVFQLRKRAERMPFTVTGAMPMKRWCMARERCSALTDWERRWLSVQREA